jgi:N utilization substance protein B
MSEQASLAKARGKARRLAMQAIYQWQMTGDDVSTIETQFAEENGMTSVDADYFRELLYGSTGDTSEIDKLLEKYMDRVVSSVDPVERAILRMACYEFLKRLDVPYRVVLNEAVTLTKKFCAAKSHTFINAVLDKVAHETRTAEMAHG